VFSILDRTEDLMYKIISMIRDLESRGHGVIVYQQADDLYQQFLDQPKLELFKTIKNIVGGYRWKAIEWQHEQGVPAMNYGSSPLYEVPDNMKHRDPRYYQTLNAFLVDYIKKNLL
jgi:hypothetical protein